jgi:hypothetical protein
VGLLGGRKGRGLGRMADSWDALGESRVCE